MCEFSPADGGPCSCHPEYAAKERETVAVECPLCDGDAENWPDGRWCLMCQNTGIVHAYRPWAKRAAESESQTVGA